ncbi:MAG: glycosyltransferase family 9 protein [Bacteroidales bacterium]
MQRNKKILVTRFSAIGDVAMTIPVLYSFANAYPEVEITFVSQPFLKKLFINAPQNLHFLPIDTKGKEKSLTGVLRFFMQLKKQRFDAVLDLHDVLRSKVLHTAFLLTGTKVYSIDKGREEKKALTAREHKVFRPLKSSFDRYRDVFVQAGFSFDLNFTSLFHPVAPDLTAISSHFGTKQGKWIGIAPFAKHAGKIYPLDKMEQVIKELHAQEELTLFLFGGGKEELDLFAQWKEEYPRIVIVGKLLQLDQELALMSQLDVMLSMDSANMHFASLTGTPVVSIWGATHPYAGFMGYNQTESNAVQLDLSCRPCSVFGNIPCFRNDYACLNNIKPGLVIEKIKQVIQK